MTRLAIIRLVPRAVLLLAGCLSLAVAAAVATRADSAGAKANQPASSQWGTAVALAAPSAGDVSYGVVRVRIARGARLMLPAGLAGQRTIFASRIGGLTIRARSARWRALRATTRVYVVVAAVPGAGASVRDVALFVVRRKARGGPSSAEVTFTIANARAQVGSFWVHGVDRHGYANVFQARNILSTALGNWSRYVRALQTANAIQAAMNPRILAAPGTATMGARTRLPGPWTGGQRPDAGVVTMYRLLVGALHDPTAYGALKLNPVVPNFIATELGNPQLAARWRAVVAHVPVKVPDQYAALAQEEKRFTHVTPPRISHAVVAILDPNNSTTVVGSDANGSSMQYLTIDIPRSAAGGTVQVIPAVVVGWGYPVYDCTTDCNYAFSLTADGQPTVSQVSLMSFPNSGSAFSHWEGCTPVSNGAANLCEVAMTPGNHTVQADFAPAYPLSVTTQPSANSGQYDNEVTSNPAGIDCDPIDELCNADFARGSSVTLTPVPGPGEAFSSWNGCDQVSGDTCTVTMSQAKNVTASFVPAAYPLTVTVQTNNPQHTGTVTSSPAGINCDVGHACTAPFGNGSTVTLTAVPNGGGFDLWQGCDQMSGYTCTVTVNQAKNVVATFG